MIFYSSSNYTQVLLLGKPILILGDLNCNILKSGPDSNALQEFITESTLTQVISKPTRVTDESLSLIDVILVSSPSLVESSGVINTSISDHLSIYTMLKLKPPKALPSHVTTRSYKNYVPSAFASKMEQQLDTLNTIVLMENVNDKLVSFNDVLISTLNNHALV